MTKRKVVRVDQSPMNEKRWCFELDCGHEVWLTRERKPKASEFDCPQCDVAGRRVPKGKQ